MAVEYSADYEYLDYTFGLGDTIELSGPGLCFPVVELFQNTSMFEEASE